METSWAAEQMREAMLRVATADLIIEAQERGDTATVNSSYRLQPSQTG